MTRSSKLLIAAAALLITVAAGIYLERRIAEQCGALSVKLQDAGAVASPLRLDGSGAHIDDVLLTRSSATLHAEDLVVSLPAAIRALVARKPLDLRIARATIDLDATRLEDLFQLRTGQAGADAARAEKAWPDVALVIDELTVRVGGEDLSAARPASVRIAGGTLSVGVEIAEGVRISGEIIRPSPAAGLVAKARLDAASDQTLSFRGSRLAVRSGSHVEIDAEDPNAAGRPFSIAARIGNAAIAQRAFSAEPWLINDARVSVKGTYDRVRRILAADARIQWGELTGLAHVDADGPWAQSHIKASVDVPSTPCTALNAPFVERRSVAAESGTLRLAADFSADAAHLADFRWTVREKSFDCRFAPQGGPFAKDFLNAAFDLVRSFEDGHTTTTRVAENRAMQLTEALRLAFQASEDTGFPWHRGVDPDAIEGALRLNFEASGLHSGASTITMQLARTLFLVPQRTIMRKLEEAMIALYLEQALDKTRILELYLSIVPFGSGVYGIKQASDVFLQKDYDALSLKEAVALAQLLPSPARRMRSLCSRGSLGVPPERVPGLLDFMFEHGWISAERLSAESAQEVVFRPKAAACSTIPAESPVVRLEHRKT